MDEAPELRLRKFWIVSAPSPVRIAALSDLAVEVVSPSESANEIVEKVQDYLSVGTEEVWVIYPKFRTLHRHLRDDPDNVGVYHEDDTLEPESLFPGLKIPVAACFKRHNFEDK